jgi:hypothetical protein
MTERTSHLSGLWIGAAISNTSHSNKAGSTTVKRAQLTGKGQDQGQWQYCHNKHKKFPYQPTHEVSLLSGHASYKILCSRSFLQRGVTVLLYAFCFIMCHYAYMCICARCGAGKFVHALIDLKQEVIVANINCIKHFISLISLL